jgi:hypothetical protein
MTRRELDAAIAVAKRALAGVRVMGMSAAGFVTDQQLSDIVQDALQAAEDVRKDTN